MPTINNQQLLKGLRDKAKILNMEAVPQQLAEKVVPVMETSPNYPLQVKSIGASDSSGSTIITTSSTKKTFLKSCSISVSKDAVSDSTTTALLATVRDNPVTNLIRMRYEPITALSNINQSIYFEGIGLELEKNTAINWTNTSATASIDVTAVITFYEED